MIGKGTCLKEVHSIGLGQLNETRHEYDQWWFCSLGGSHSTSAGPGLLWTGTPTLLPCSVATCLFCSSSDLFPTRIFCTFSGAYWKRMRKGERDRKRETLRHTHLWKYHPSWDLIKDREWSGNWVRETGGRGGQIKTEKRISTINKILFLGFIFKPIYSNYLIEHSFQYFVLRNDYSNKLDIFVWSSNCQKREEAKSHFLPSSDKRTLIVVLPTGDDRKWSLPLALDLTSSTSLAHFIMCWKDLSLVMS